MRSCCGSPKTCAGAPRSTTTLPSKNDTRPAASLAWPGPCVTTAIVQPSAASSLMTASTAPTSSGSSDDVGSWPGSIEGLSARARDADPLLLAAGER